MTDPCLFSVLDRATDGIEPGDAPQAATAALARAWVIRTRRRGLVAGGVAAAAVLAVVVATGVTGSDRSTPPITPSSTVPEMPDSAVQSTWDPRGAADLPQRTTALPQTIVPARNAGPLPLPTAALLVMDDSADGLYVLGADGTWASTTAPSGSSHVTAISDDGTMLANVGPDGLWVTDVRDGDWRQLDLPEPAMVWEGLGTSLTWRGDTGLVLRSGGGDLGFVDADGSRPTGDGYDGTLVSGFAVAPDGAEVVFGDGRDGK